MKFTDSSRFPRSSSRKGQFARLGQKAFMAMMVGQLAVTTQVVQATDYNVPLFGFRKSFVLEDGDTLTNRGTIGVPAPTGATVTISDDAEAAVTNRGTILSTRNTAISMGSGSSLNLSNRFIIGGRTGGISGENIDSLSFTNYAAGSITVTQGSAIDINGASGAVNISNNAAAFLTSTSDDATTVRISGTQVSLRNDGFIISSGSDSVHLEGIDQVRFNNASRGSISDDVSLFSDDHAIIELEARSNIGGNLNAFSSNTIDLVLLGNSDDHLSDAVDGDFNLVSQAISLTKIDSGIWTLDKAFNVSDVRVQDGGLIVTLDDLFENADVTLDDGFLQLAGGSRTKTLNWNDGHLRMTLDGTSGISTDTFTVADGLKTFEFDMDWADVNMVHQLVMNRIDKSSYDVGQFTADFIGSTAGQGLEVEFLRVSNLTPTHPYETLAAFVYKRSEGSLLQNSAPVNTPVDTTFVINGFAQTGDPSENNTIAALLFEGQDGELVIHNELTLTSGTVVLKDGVRGELSGDRLHATDVFAILGEGTLVLANDLKVQTASSMMNVATVISEGKLDIGNTAFNYGNFEVAGRAFFRSGIINTRALTISGMLKGDVMNGGSFSIANDAVMRGRLVTGLVEGSDLDFSHSIANIYGTLRGGIHNAGTLNVAGTVAGSSTSGGLYNTATGYTTVSGRLEANPDHLDGVINEGSLRVTATGTTSGILSNTGTVVIDGRHVGSVWNGDIFVVNGQVESTTFVNAATGILGGSGQIVGNLYNSGTLNPGNSPGTLTVVGDFTQSASGLFIVEIESGSSYDVLNVTGTANLAGDIVISGNVDFGNKYRFLKAGKIVGDFDDIYLQDGVRGRFQKTSTSYTLLFAPEKYSDLATTPNHRSVAKALDTFIGGKGDKDVVSLALDELSIDEYSNAFQQISPALHETIGTQAINLSQQQGRLLQQRVGTARYGLRGGFQSSTVAPALQTDRDGKSVHQSKAVKEVVTTTTVEPNRWSSWIEGNGVFSRVTQAAQVPNGRTRAGGFIIGTDYAWNPNFITGLFAGYEGLETKYTDESRATMNSARFGGYGTYTLNNGLYLDGIVWGGAGEYDVHRRIKFGNLDRTANSTQETGEFSTIFGTGYDWKPGNWIVGPTASMQYTYLGIDGFEERDAKSLNLDMDRQSIHSLRSNLGARLAYRYEINENAVIVPELRASWEHEFLNDARNLDGQLGGTNITYRTQAGERDSLFAGAGINALFNNRVSTSVNYNVDVGRSNDTAHIISASFGVQW